MKLTGEKMTTEELSDVVVGEGGGIAPLSGDPTLKVIERHLPPNYSGVRAFREGGTRYWYSTCTQ